MNQITYVIARSEASYRIFIKRTGLSAFDYLYLYDVKAIHNAKSGTVFIILKDCEKSVLGKQAQRILRYRLDLVRLREW